MKRLLLLLVASFIYLPLLSQKKAPLPEKLSVEFNTNVELLGFAYFLAFEGVGIENKTVEVDGEEVPKKEFHSYGYHFYQKYQQYAESENLLKALMVADHLWLDYIINLLLQLDNFPNAEITPGIGEGDYIRFSKTKNRQEARQNVDIFLEGLNAFYAEVRFDQYLAASKEKYAVALEEVKGNVSKASVIEDLEQFYRREFKAYYLVPSLTIPKGMGFGPNPEGDTIFNVFGALGPQEFLHPNQLKMGFDYPPKIRELSIHEFGHSFANPVVAGMPENYFTATEELFEPIKNAMEQQGYNTWKASVYEHFVRVGEIAIANRTDSKEDAERLQNEYIEDRKFIYIPVILKELEKYREEGSYSYEEAVARAFSALRKVAEK